MDKIFHHIATEIKLNTDFINNREKLKALLRDCIPQNRLYSNLLLIAFDAGISNAILQTSEINDLFYNKYIHVLVSEYGIKEENAHWCIIAWCEIYAKHVLNLPVSISKTNPPVPQKHKSSKKNDTKKAPAKGNSLCGIGDIIWSNSGIEIEYRGLDFQNSNLDIKLLITNKTSRNIDVRCDNLAINDLIVGKGILTAYELVPHRKSLGNTYWYLKDAGIMKFSDIKAIDFQLYYYDSGTLDHGKVVSPIIKVAPVQI